MRHAVLSILLLCVLSLWYSCNNSQGVNFQDVSNMPETTFDSVLAKTYGADEYGMKSYTMALLYAGPNRDLDSASAAQLQRAHLDNIQRMSELKKLVFAGPFLDEDSLRGIYIFNTSLSEADSMTKTDPAIQAGSLNMVLKPFYGSAALEAIPELHKRISAKKI